MNMYRKCNSTIVVLLKCLGRCVRVCVLGDGLRDALLLFDRFHNNSPHIQVETAILNIYTQL